MQQIGVRAVLETSKFEAGLKRYQDGLDAAIAKTLQFQNTLNNLRAVQSPTVRPPAGTTQPQIKPITQQLPNINQQGLVNINTSNINAGAAAVRGLGQAAQQASGQVNFLNQVVTGMAYSVGSLITKAFTDLGGNLLRAGEYALEVTTRFERLGFSIESLVAREVMNSGAATNMADALALAGPRAEELLKWITQLAVRSPFTEAGVQAVFQQALAYGFASEEAQRLTQDIIDYTAASGRTEDEARRMALALGQIRNEGKLLMRDLRQLINVGVDVNSILVEMGYDISDVGKEVIDAGDFLNEFVEMMENDYAGAAERSSKTIGGLINSLNDLRDVTMRELTRPFFMAFQPMLSALVDQIFVATPAFTYLGAQIGAATTWIINNASAMAQAALSIGAFVAGIFLVINAGAILTATIAGVTALLGAIGSAFLFLLSPIGLVAVAIGTLAALFVFSFEEINEQAGGVFNNLGNDMFSWGYNITVQLANGIAAGIGAVIDALIYIGQIITSWLMPGSPPKLLPELDRWGEEAANVYMDGWSKMNFDVFNDLSGTFESFIRSFANISIPETEIVPRIQGMNNAIAQVIQQMKDFGTVSEDAIAQAVQAIGIADPAVERYIRDLLALENANNAVRRAQEYLNEITERYAELLRPINNELDAINKRRQEVKDQERTVELNAILNDENAPALAKELALMELREIELKKQKGLLEEQQNSEEYQQKQRLDAAKEEQARLKAQADATKALIDAQANQNKLINEQIKLLERIAKAEEARAKAAGAGGGAEPRGDFEPANLGGGFTPPALGEIDIDGFIEKFENAKKQLLAPFEALEGKLRMLQMVWGDVFAGMGSKWEEFKKSHLGDMDKFFNKDLPKWLDGIGLDDQGLKSTAVFSLLALFGAFVLIPALLNPVGALIAALIISGLILIHVWDTLTKSWDGVAKNLGIIMSKFSFVNPLENFKGAIDSAISNIDLMSEALWNSNNVIGGLYIAFTFIGRIILAVFSGISYAVIGLWETIVRWFELGSGKLAVTIDGLGGWWVRAWNWIASTFEGIMDGIVNWAEESIGNVKTAIETTTTNIQSWWDTTWNAISEFFSTTWEDMVKKTNEEIAKIQESINTTYTEIKRFIETTWEAIKTFFSTKWVEMLAAVNFTLTLINFAITTIIGAIRVWWEEEWPKFVTAVTTAMDSIVTGITNMIASAVELFYGFLNDIEDFFESNATLNRLLAMGRSFIGGIRRGIENEIPRLIQELINAVGAGMSAIRTAIGMGSPAKKLVPVGESIITGIVQGIQNNAKLVRYAMNDVAEIATNTSINPLCVDPVIPPIPPSNGQGNNGARPYPRRRPDLIGPPIIGDDWGGLIDPVLREIRRRVGFIGPPQRSVGQSAIPFGATSNNNAVTLTVSFNDIKINNGMDMQNFAGQVREAVISALDTSIGSGV